MKETGTEGFELQDIKAEHIDASILDRLAEHEGSYEALFNKRAQKFKANGLNTKAYTEDEWRELILSEYTFLKRPVYIIEEDVFVGNSKKTVEAIQARLSE